MRILIVEDHSGIRIALEMILELEGHYAVAVDRGEDALAMLQASAEPFDVVLLDLNTNGITADEFMGKLNELCQSQSVSRPRVGILSGSSTIEREAKRIGADFIVKKPFEQEQILAAILDSSSHLPGDEYHHAQAI